MLQATDLRKLETLDVIGLPLTKDAHKLVYLVIDREEDKLQAYAKQEAIIWAKHSLTLGLKFKFVQAIRRTVWLYIHRFSKLKGNDEVPDFYKVEKEMNNLIDRYLKIFTINYSQFKDSLVTAQTELFVNLSVHIIPISLSVGFFLPLVSANGIFRTSMFEKKIFAEIERNHFNTLIIDFSEIVDIKTKAIDNLSMVIKGASMMGCNTVLTGIKAKITRELENKVDKPINIFTIQQALNQYLK